MTVAANHFEPVQIGACNEPRIFTLSEARVLFPMVRTITAAAHDELEPVRRRLEATLPTNPELPAIEREYEDTVKRWAGKMERLGVVVKGLWLVDFDTGEGFLCWRYPELSLGHFHDYHEGFTSRRSIAEIIEERDPDWARF